MSDKVAVVVGLGMVGLNLTKHLLKEDWKVYGVSRNKYKHLPAEVHHISVDLTDGVACKTALAKLLDVNYVFYAPWQDQGFDFKAASEVNKTMIENFIDNLPGQLKHFALVTGTKHYWDISTLATFKQSEENAPFRESQLRVAFPHAYYVLEDVMFDRAEKRNFNWSVARPSTIIGFYTGGFVNEAVAIAVYASLCKHLHLPFIFPGSKDGFNVFLDATDVDLLSEHLIWEATEPSASNQAFNVVNGDIYRWKFLWPAIAEYFGMTSEGPTEIPIDLARMMKVRESAWKEITTKHGLKQYKLSDLVPNWHYQGGNLCRPGHAFSDMSKSREKGFLRFESTKKSFFKVFDYLRENKYIPHTTKTQLHSWL